ncbi:anti-sigma factor RsbA family regulatory protein [Micromonospora mangrovi]|uniref:Anti-sigma factor RsbA family regulatory protein n=2 Tax=Micromonospora TaxID=1873 RepID=A0AAU8HP32_9ACTN
MTDDGPSASPPDGLRHDALLYADDRDYLDAIRAFAAEGRAAGEPVLVAVPTHRLASVRAALTGLDGIEFADLAVLGRNPAAIIPGTLHRFPGRRTRIIGEWLWPDRRPAAFRHCVGHEAALDLVFAGQQLATRCLFDRTRLPADALADIRRTHRWLVAGGVARLSPDHLSPHDVLTRLAAPLPAPPPYAVTRPVESADLGALRAAVAAVATAAGLTGERLDDLRIAVTELASNALTHAAPPAVVRCWVAAGELLCEVTSRGELRDPLAGRVPPPADSVRGRGLLLVQQLCDLVDIRAADGTTTVRLHLELPPAAPASAPGAAQGGCALAL